MIFNAPPFLDMELWWVVYIIHFNTYIEVLGRILKMQYKVTTYAYFSHLYFT